MIKNALSDSGMPALAAFGLLMFVAIFVGVTVWALTRRRRQVERWSSLPLVDGPEPVEPRAAAAASLLPVAGEGRGCGECENCSC
ncbi:MAG: cbb3-type cytochrome c oxidase subunit 3 [Planctomycetota bacterium]